MGIVSYSQNFEDVMLWRALQHVELGFYIDVGANDPSVDSVTRAFYERGWHGINIEPLETHYRDLVAARPNDINLCCAAGASPGEIEIWECDVRGWATASEEVVRQHEMAGHSGSYRKISVSRLSDICEKYAGGEIHFLKIDVEGFERQVLEGMDFERFRPWIVVIEATRPNSRECVHEDWEPGLIAARYIFAYADGLNRFYISSEHQELMAFFCYPPNVFDSFSSAALIAANERGSALQEKIRTVEEAYRFAERCKEQSEARAELAEARAESAEVRAQDADVRAKQAEERCQRVEFRAEQSEVRAELAEACAQSAEARAQNAEACAKHAEERIQRVEFRAEQSEVRAALAEARSQSAEARAQKAEARAKQAEERSQRAEFRAEQSEARAEFAEARAQSAEVRAQSAEVRGQQAEERSQRAEIRAGQSEACAQSAVGRAANAEKQVAEAQLRLEAEALRAHSAENLAAELEQRVAAVEASMHQGWQQAKEWHARILALHNSTSWKITRPVRALGRIVRRQLTVADAASLSAGKFKKFVRARVVSTIKQAGDHAHRSPGFKRIAFRLLRGYPSLQHKLRRVYLENKFVVQPQPVNWIATSPDSLILPDPDLPSDTNCVMSRPVRPGINANQRSPLESSFQTYISQP